MGSGSEQQQQQQASSGQQQQQVQKGWLSRWTRKQWSRHWFVLKNGSITYYRGPAAELCSFLDGVLDLSLIKHIEVAQAAEESAVQVAHQHQHPHAHQNQNQHQVQQFHTFTHYQVFNTPANTQQETQQHFDFTLKMWNGEAHLLSAQSAAERQSWLAAINSCTSFDDDTASSDSSSSTSSSCASNLSAKSTDIGGATSGGATSITTTTTTTTNPASSAFQVQQQQQREAELSLEQLALKLKSAVRRARHVTSHEDEEQQQQQQQQQQLHKTSQATPSESLIRRRPFALDDDDDQQDDDDDDTEADEKMEHDDDDDDEQVALSQRNNETDEMLSIKSYSSLASSASSLEVELEVSREPEVARPTQDNKQEASKDKQRQKKRVTFDLSNQDLSKYSRIDRDLSSSSSSSSEVTSEDSSSADEEPQDDEEADSSPPLSSSSDDDDEHEQANENETCEEQEVTSSSQEQKHERDEESEALLDYEQIKRIEVRRKLELKRQLSYSRQKENDEDEDSTCELVRRMIERRKLRLLNRTAINLSDEHDEDGDATMTSACTSPPASNNNANNNNATCDMDTSVGVGAAAAAAPADNNDDNNDNNNNNNDNDEEQKQQVVSCSTGSSTCQIIESRLLGEDKNTKDESLEEASSESVAAAAEKQMKHINQLEDRLKSAQFNIDILERRLNDSYLNYNQLEVSYKQLQCQLVECQQLNANNLLQMQRKIDQLTQELKSSEVKLFEAKEKLIKYEEHLAKWQHDNQQQVDTQATTTTTTTTTDCHNIQQDAIYNQPKQTTSQLNKSVQPMSVKMSNNHKTSWLLRNSLVSSASHFNPSHNHSSLTHMANLYDHHHHHHQPLFLMHHLKQSLSINQQQLSLKLLSQSKQIQRKLNELEIKVDKIQSAGGNCAPGNLISVAAGTTTSTTTSTTTITNASTNNSIIGNCTSSGSTPNIEHIANSNDHQHHILARVANTGVDQ